MAQAGLGMVPKLRAQQAVGWLLTKISLWGLAEDQTCEPLLVLLAVLCRDRLCCGLS